jgi:signal peptidase II
MKIFNKRLLVRYIIIFIIFLVGIDQITKNITQRTRPEIDLFAGFSIEYRENPGWAFGFLSGTKYGAFVGLVINVIFILFVIFYYNRYLFNKNNITYKIFFGFAFALSGAIGTIIDRALYGFVRDFIAIPKYAVINLSDILLVIGGLLILIEVFKYSKSQKKKSF